jgi:hypothetical protein
MFQTNVDEVDVDAVDRGHELRQRAFSFASALRQS